MLIAAISSLAAVATAAPVEHAAEKSMLTSQAHIFNRCTFDVNYWINNEGSHVLPAGGNWSEPFRTSGSRTITLMTSPRLFSADPKVLIGYSYRPDQATVYYDFYSGYGTTPFQGFKVV
jgi:hypothetical protein